MTLWPSTMRYSARKTAASAETSAFAGRRRRLFLGLRLGGFRRFAPDRRSFGGHLLSFQISRGPSPLCSHPMLLTLNRVLWGGCLRGATRNRRGFRLCLSHL